MVVGGLLKEATQKFKDVLGVYEDIDAYKERVKEYLQTEKNREFRAKYIKPEHINWDEDKFYGNGYSAYSLGCYVAEVEVDRVDFSVKVTNFYAINDVGEIVNPTLAEGQVEGGVTQGIGYALYEQLVYENGAIKNPHISNYVTPMAADLNKIEIEFLNTHESSKGLGELPVDGVAPAILNAVSHALDIECDSLPLTAEKLEMLCR
jgi:CO/xanthine dehydrogenase Mo-binding subunit